MNYKLYQSYLKVSAFPTRASLCFIHPEVQLTLFLIYRTDISAYLQKSGS